MIEELVKYETALLAKNKGFKENVVQCYNNNKDLISTYELNNIGCEGGLDYIDFLSDYNNQPDFEKYFEYKLDSAPSQSLLQKWLREKHNLHISVSNTSMDVFENNYYPVLNYGFHCGESTTDTIITYKTYEEALEKGLYTALNLIK